MLYQELRLLNPLICLMDLLQYFFLFCVDCPFGDQADWCADHIASYKFDCYRVNSTCCGSCRRVEIDVPGNIIQSTNYVRRVHFFAQDQ